MHNTYVVHRSPLFTLSIKKYRETLLKRESRHYSFETSRLLLACDRGADGQTQTAFGATTGKNLASIGG